MVHEPKSILLVFPISSVSLQRVVRFRALIKQSVCSFTSGGAFVVGVFVVQEKLDENGKVKSQSSQGAGQPRRVDPQVVPAHVNGKNGNDVCEVSQTSKEEKHEGHAFTRLALVVEQDLRNSGAQIENGA